MIVQNDCGIIDSTKAHNAKINQCTKLLGGKYRGAVTIPFQAFVKSDDCHRRVDLMPLKVEDAAKFALKFAPDLTHHITNRRIFTTMGHLDIRL